MSISPWMRRAFVALGNELAAMSAETVRGRMLARFAAPKHGTCRHIPRRLNTAVALLFQTNDAPAPSRAALRPCGRDPTMRDLRGRVRVGTAWRMQQFAPVNPGDQGRSFDA